MYSVISLTKVEIRALFREPVTVFFMLVVPIILTVVFGGAFGKEQTKFGPDVLGIDTIIPINLVFLLANTGLMGIPITILELKEQGVIKRYSTYPIQYRTYFIALLLTFAGVSIVSLALFSSLSFIFYGAKFHMSLAQTFLWVIVSLLVMYIFFGMGYLLALIIRSSRTATVISGGLFTAMLFTSGVIMPLESEPVYIQRAAELLPMSHSVTALQLAWVGESMNNNYSNDVVYLILMGLLLTVALTVVRIKWDSRG